MALVVTTFGALVSTATGNTGGATNNNNVTMGSNVDNGIVALAGNQYVVTMTTDGYFHLFKSTDGGTTWAVVGTPVDNSLRVAITGGGPFNQVSGGIAVRQNGGLLYVFYSTQQGVPNTIGSAAGVYYKTYNPGTNTWSAETFAHYPSSVSTDRPNNADTIDVFFRPDGSIAVILVGSAGGTGGEHTGCLIMLFVAGVGTVYKIWGGYGYTGTGNTQWLCTGAAMKPDGTILMWGSVNDSGAVASAGPFSVLQFSPGNVASGPTNLPNSLNGAAWDNGAIGAGDFDSLGNGYAPALVQWGASTSQSHIAMAYQSAGVWNATPVLDAPTNYDVISTPLLRIVSGYILMMVPIVLDGSAFPPQALLRLGYCLQSVDFTNPVNWTWQTVFNFPTNTPPIAGTVAPNTLQQYTGVSYSFTDGGDGSSTMRVLASTQDTNGTGALDVVHLFDVSFTSPVTTTGGSSCCCCCYPTRFANQMICSGM